MRYAILQSVLVLSLLPTLTTLAQTSSSFQERRRSTLNTVGGASKIDQLRRQSESNERAVRQTATQLRRAREEGGRSDASAAELDTLKMQLRERVTSGFDIRQQIHRAELAQLGQKLDQAREKIQQRDQLKSEIIDRRVEDLLNPNLRWDSMMGDPAQPARTVTQRISSTIRKTSPSLAETVRAQVAKREQKWAALQGTWVLDRTKSHPTPRTLSIDRTTWKFTDASGAETGTVQLDAQGAGQIIAQFGQGHFPQSTWMGNYEIVDGTLAIHFKSANLRGSGYSGGGTASETTLEETLWNWSGVYHRPDK